MRRDKTRDGPTQSTYVYRSHRPSNRYRVKSGAPAALNVKWLEPQMKNVYFRRFSYNETPLFCLPEKNDLNIITKISTHPTSRVFGKSRRGARVGGRHFTHGGRLRAPSGRKATGGTFRRDFSSLALSNYIFPVKHSRLEGAEQSQRAPKGGMAQWPPAYAPAPDCG